MNRYFVLLCFILFINTIFAQEIVNKTLDSLYREDQFYFGVTYNILSNSPDDLSQAGFSSGFHLGFIRDMPINKKRTMALGIGLGYSTNSYNNNLLINNDDFGAFSYTILEDGNTYSKNKFSTHLVEIPLEFRWRTSTASDYNFWRIYTGFKFGYLFSNTTKYEGDLGNIKLNNIDSFNNLQYGLSLSVGYNTWNIYVYYALNPVFTDDVLLNGNNLDINTLKVGLIFYIL
ncbi:porin family protein [Algibacter aquimarinus]